MDDLASDPGDSVTNPESLVVNLRLGVALAALLVGCVALTAGVTSWVEYRGGQVVMPRQAPSGSVVVAAADASGSLTRVGAVQPLLDRRAGAVRTGQPAEWAATVDGSAGSRGFRVRQLAEFDRLRLLPIRVWRYELIETAPLPGASAAGVSATGTPAAGAFTARVRLVHRLAGDTRDVERVQVLTVARRGGGWFVTGVRREGGEADPWELGPLAVQQGRRGVVIGIGATRSGPSLRRVAQEVDEAAARVDEAWGTGWPRTVVVIVPSGRDELVALLGKDRGTGLDQVAAVTNGELARGPAARSPAAGGSADRVVINPGAFERLSALGRRVVLTHELTHVATRATSRVAAPLWVEEGFATYVAYRDSGLARGLLAEDVRPLVRAGTAGERLPGPEAFDPAGGPIAPAYANAWLAFDLMARDGPRRPFDFYRVAVGLSTAGGSPVGTSSTQAVAEAFRRVLGTDQAGFEARWRSYRAMVLGEVLR